MARELTECELIERSINKRFRKELWRPFVLAIRRYDMIQTGDKIGVCISGGKDSMLMAKLFQELQRHSDVPFELEFIVMDPGYRPENRQKIIDNAARMNIPIRIFESDIFDVADKAAHNPCYLCARMRRGFLYNRAQELGCNKIALGHHFNDVVETTVIGMFYGAQIQAMPPRVHSKNFPGMELIRPLYCIHEDDIINWCRYNGLSFIQCACKLTERVHASEDGVGTSKRQEIKLLLRELKKTNPDIEKSVFKAIHNVNLDTMVGLKTRDGDVGFTELYAQRGQGGEED